MPTNEQTSDVRPETESLRQAGWQIYSQIGSYCVAWRQNQESVFVWRESRWELMSQPVRKAA